MKYALVLEGGGARGSFEAGAIDALKEMKINPTAVVGTSVGAINGAVFAVGKNPSDFWNFVKSYDIVNISSKNDNLFSVSGIFQTIKNGFHGGLDYTPLRELISSVITEKDIRKSKILYGLCTFNASEKKSIELFSEDIPQGHIIDYILASACFPVFRPIKINGTVYSDGGIRNNLPVNMLIKKGYDTIIAVKSKGIGFTPIHDLCGINIIEINSSKPEIGIMDFNKHNICRNIAYGSLETKKQFGLLCGKKFYIDKNSYLDAQKTFGLSVLEGLETAANILKLDRFRIYTFNQLADTVINCIDSNPRLKHILRKISSPHSEYFGKSINLAGEYFHAANTALYLSIKLNKCNKKA